MEYFLFFIIIFVWYILEESSKKRKYKKHNTFVKNDNNGSVIKTNPYWTDKFYHKKTNAHYPKFLFDKNGWSLEKVYLPYTNTDEFVHRRTGDKYNSFGFDYNGNKKVTKDNYKTKKTNTQNERVITERNISPDKTTVNEQYVYTDKKLKTFWKSMNPFFDFVNVDKFYHFTDARNLKSIVESKGLYSWYSLENKSIKSHVSSNSLSRNLDIKHGLENYIRLSFTDYNPMSSRVIHEEKREIIWLEIDRSIAFLQDTLFSDKNATDNNVSVSNEFDFLKKLDYPLFEKRYSSLNIDEKKQYQAEILIKEFLPLEYILNIDELKRRYL